MYVVQLLGTILYQVLWVPILDYMVFLWSCKWSNFATFPAHRYFTNQSKSQANNLRYVEPRSCTVTYLNSTMCVVACQTVHITLYTLRITCCLCWCRLYCNATVGSHGGCCSPYNLLLWHYPVHGKFKVRGKNSISKFRNSSCIGGWSTKCMS